MRFALALVFALLLPVRAFAFTIIVTEPDVPLVPNSILELAQSLGYFAREGVDVQFNRVSGTPMAVAALSSGQGDMANVSLDAMLKLAARGETGFRAISASAKSMSYVIASRGDIASIAQLRGTAFGIGQTGTLDDTLTRRVLAREGLSEDKVSFVSVGQPQLRLKALKAGKIDATTISYGSWLALPDKTGLRLLLSANEFARSAPTIAKVNVVGTQALREKRDELRKVTAALFKVARDFAREPQSWAEAMAKARPDVPSAQLQQLARAYAGEWCVNGCFESSELQAAADVLRSAPPMRDLPHAGLDRWVERSVLDDVLAQIGRAAAARPAAGR
jgi:NitT/TauT family transport system substrate-binding protein